MFFSKVNFIKNAPSNVRRLLGDDHLNALDGKEVHFKNHNHGRVNYEIENDEVSYYIEPVHKSWCANEKQTELF